MKMYEVQWVSEEKATELVNKRKARALEKLSDQNSDELRSAIESEDSTLWDWIEPDECLEAKSFKSQTQAKKWAASNASLDYFGNIRVVEFEVDGDEKEIISTLEFQSDKTWLSV